MKPQFERVTFPKGCSLRVYHRRVSEIPFEWHHHPEYELTLTLNSRGWRFVGDHIGQYQAPDLVLVPSDMPHTWASTATLDEENPHTAIVIWFSGAWALQVAEILPEYGNLRKLLRNSATGLAFSQDAATRMVALQEGLLGKTQPPGCKLRLTFCWSLRKLRPLRFPRPALLWQPHPIRSRRNLRVYSTISTSAFQNLFASTRCAGLETFRHDRFIVSSLNTPARV